MAMTLVMKYIAVILLTIACLCMTEENVPKGHLQPLGCHRPKESSIESLDYVPYPREFYQTYVLGSKAVILKGAAKMSKGFELWTDDYLRTNHGKEIVRVDYGKKENRYHSADNMPLEEFLKIYNYTDRYLIDTLPRSMWKDFSLPRCLLCGGYTSALQDSVLWFSSGGTKSHLHNDKVENINCLFSGHKTWFFVDAFHSKSIIMDHKDGEYCSVNVDRVDMYKYPSLQNIPWWIAELQAGDCIYVPYGWAHQVTSLSRNLAVNIWWSPDITFNESLCQDQSELSNFKFTYGEMLRFQAIQVINDGGGSITFGKINALILHEHTGEKLITKKRFDLLDGNKDGLLTEEELRSVSTGIVEEAFGFTPPGEVNLVGAYRQVDWAIHDSIKDAKLEPYVEEFVLKPDKTRQDIKDFLNINENQLPAPVKECLMNQIVNELHIEESGNQNHDEF